MIRLFAWLLLLPSVPSFAQEHLDAIRIRALKEEKSALEITDSVTVIKDEGLEGTGSEDSLQILSGLPNVQVNKSGESFSIRGINSAGVTGYQKDNLASIVVDGIFQTDLALAAGGFDLWDMERIEILRGAQSTSQGVNSLAGTILLSHEPPRSETSGAARLGTGTFNQREGAFTTNHRLGENSSTRLSYEKETNDGFIRNIATGNGKWGSKNKDAANLGFLQRLSESQRLRLVTRYLRNDQGGSYVQSPNPFDDEVKEDVDARTVTESRQVALQHEWTISDAFSNKTTIAFSGASQKARADADGTSAATAGARNESHADRYLSFENLLYYRSENTRNLLGLHAHDFTLKDRYDFNLLYPVTPTVTTPVHVDQTVDRARTVFSVFDAVQHRLNEGLWLQAGLRFEHALNKYGTDVDPRRTQNLGASNPAVDAKLASYRGAYDDRKTNSILLPKLGFVQDLGDGHHIGAAYTKGYRTGGLSINRTRAAAVPYDPEFTDNYELSYKFEREGLSLGANAFYIDWRDQQVQVRLSNDFYDTQVANAAKSQVYGAELQAQIADDVSNWSFGAGHVTTSFRDFVNGTVDYHGNRFPFAAPWTARISHWRRLTERLSVTAVARYLARSYANTENTRTSAEQYYADLSGQYQWDAVMIEAYARNVFDNRFLVYDGRPQNMTADYQSVYSQVNTPRELGARVTYFW